MYANSMAQRAYKQADAPTRSIRQLEYDVVARITHELHAASAKAKTDFPRLAKALHKNSQLWTILAADVARKGNELPKELRARIMFLSEFTRRHTAQVLASEATATPLVEINTAILRGLNTREANA